MNYRLLWIPVALLAAVVFVSTEEAQAAPTGISAHTGVALGTRIYVGGRVGIPVGRRGGYYREYVEYTGGYYVTRTRQVEVPGRQIGWGFDGQPLYEDSRVVVRKYRVWVPRRRLVRRVWVPRRSRGFISVGGRIRLR